MADSNKPKISHSAVAISSFALLALWCVSAFMCLRHGGKDIARVSPVWPFYIFFGTLISGLTGALLIYGCIRRPETRTALTIFGIIAGFLPFVGFAIFIAVKIVQSILTGED